MPSDEGRPSYHATAQLERGRLSVNVPAMKGVAVRTGSLAGAEQAIREVIAADLGVPPDSFDVIVEWLDPEHR